jgi:hypothetical protein
VGDGRRSEGRKVNGHSSVGRNAILAWRWWSIALTITTVVRGTKGKRIRRPPAAHWLNYSRSQSLSHLFHVFSTYYSSGVQHQGNHSSSNPRSVLSEQSSSIHFPFATALGRHGLLKMHLLIHYSSLKATKSHPSGFLSVCSTLVSFAT